MIPLRFIRQNREAVRQGLLDKGMAGDELNEILALDEQLREKITQVESLKARRNQVSQEIGQLKQEGRPAKTQIEAMGAVSPEIKALDQMVHALQEQVDQRLLWLPNLPHPSVPVGHNASSNRVVATVGDPARHSFQAQDHLALLENLSLVDFEAGARIAGRGFPVYVGRGARLERALINFMLDLHTREHGYTEVYPPFMATRKATQTTGQLPKLEGEMYVTSTDDLFLIPTAEVPITNMFQGQIITEDDLPLNFAAFSACFRREAGSYGKETKGLLRLHQFNKVELVKFVHPDTSYGELETVRAHAEVVLRRLGLTYRVVELCSGDLSFAAAKCYDLELYAPAMDSWLEVSSCSNFEAFQARRGQIRFRRNDTDKLDYVHTLNGSGVATPRLMAALLESCQQRDGSVVLPQPLVPYYGEETVVPL